VAEPLKHQFGHAVVIEIADMLDAAGERAGVDRAGFVADCLDGFDDLELTARAQHIADAMAQHLPADRELAMRILIDSLGPELDGSDAFGMGPFRYLPHVKFVAEHGQGHFGTAMQLQYELTKRFTAEFSIRHYLVGEHRDATLRRLREWTLDPNDHVRRLVSEGTRPRLPWAGRLQEFVRDPGPVIELLELLRHDRSEYVRRSVANNLNDIAKDHPTLVTELCARWWDSCDPDQIGEERRMIRHALRTLVRQGDPDALDVLGFGSSSPARVRSATIEPTSVAIGGKVHIEVMIEHPEGSGVDVAGALVDLSVHFVKANGSTSAKVFKGAELQLARGRIAPVRKTISLQQRSTRTHHPGKHRVDALVNGVAVEIGAFDLSD
jgi:3-methyladenine DNA glycosylase AlkC